MAYKQEETIYNIVERVIPEPPKPPIYRSKHDPKMAPSCSTFKTTNTSKPGVQNMSGVDALRDGGNTKYEKPAATFGPVPGTSKVDPALWKERLAEKKSGAVASANSIKKMDPDVLLPSELKPQHKPGVPKGSSDSTQPYRPCPPTTKNFIVANAVEAILACPKKVKQDPPNFKDSENYGKVPRYLEKIKADIKEEYEYIQRLQAEEEADRQNQVQEMTGPSRQDLIDGLKKRWEKVNLAYQAQTHLTKLDTLGKIRRKETCEKELSQLEKDIEKLSKARIFVDTTH